jgi:hypothetical protein
MANNDSDNDTADDTANDWSMAAPAFRAPSALETLKRSLRDARLAERAGGFELKGRRLIELSLDGERIAARIAQRPALTPTWDTRSISNHHELRRFQDEVKRRMARWQDDES